VTEIETENGTLRKFQGQQTPADDVPADGSVKTLVASLLVVGMACRRDQSAKIAVESPAPRTHATADAAAVPTPGAVIADAGADASGPLSRTEQAMARLVTAVVAKDPAAVLACFSKKKPIWFISHTVDGKTSKLRFTCDTVAKGMKVNGDFWYYFFDEESELVQAIEDHQRWPHTQNGTFVPPGYEKNSDSAPAAVRWRKEGEAYVIDTLFDSGA
jgi:hypothetical protein